MQTAWRERNPVVRIKAAHSALEMNPECAPAYILLAEEEATTIIEAEKILKNALKVAEANYRYLVGFRGHFHFKYFWILGSHKRYNTKAQLPKECIAVIQMFLFI